MKKYLGKNQGGFTNCQWDIQEAWWSPSYLRCLLVISTILLVLCYGKAKLQFGHWRVTDTHSVIVDSKTWIATEAAAAEWLLLSLSHEVEPSSSIATKGTFFTRISVWNPHWYAGRNSSKVSIKNLFIWEGKDLKSLFHFALSIGTRFQPVPNHRAQWSICKCTLSFINKSGSIRDKSTVPWGWDRCAVACLYECTPTISLKKIRTYWHNG